MFNTKELTIFVILGCAVVHGYVWCSGETSKIVSEKCLEEMGVRPGTVMERLPNGTLILNKKKPTAKTTEITETSSGECVKQYGVNIDDLIKRNGTLTKEELIAEITPERYSNIAVCTMKRWLGTEKTIKKHITDSLNKAETKYTKAEMDELRDTVEKCIIKVKGDEPKLIECLEPWKNNRTDDLLEVRHQKKIVFIPRPY